MIVFNRWLMALLAIGGARVSAEALVRRARYFSLLAALCASVATAVPVAHAARSFRIGIVANTVPIAEWRDLTSPDGAPNAAAVITRGLSELGWVEGKNVEFVWRSAEGRLERLPAIFEELVALPVDVIVAIGPGAVEAAKVTRTTPIVMAASAGAVSIGLAASLGRPATNVTGLSFEASPALEGKKLALLKQSAPQILRVAILSEGQKPAAIPRSIRDAASALGMKVLPVSFATLEEIEGAIASAARQGADALLVMDGVWVHRRSCQLTINAHAIRFKLPVCMRHWGELKREDFLLMESIPWISIGESPISSIES